MSPAAGVGSVVSSLRRAADRVPGHPALIGGTAHFWYASLCDRVERLASALTEDGVESGDRIALLIGHTPDHVLAYSAALAAGAVVVPIDPNAPPAVISRVFEDAAPAAAIVEPALAATISSLVCHAANFRRLYVTGTEPTNCPPPICNMHERLVAARPMAPLSGPREDSLAAIVYTSGTTGTPKGVMLSHRNLGEIAAAGQSLFGVTGEDRLAVVTPLFHLYGLREIDLAFASAATLVLPADVRFPAPSLQLFASARVTGLAAVPSWLSLILQRYRAELAPWADSLRYLAIGTAPLSARDLQLLRDLLPRTRLVVTYGLTEASRVCWRDVSEPSTPHDPRSVGKPYPGVELELLDEADGVGRVAVRSGMVMMGNWNRPDATREILTEGGDLLTPDYGCFDSGGALHLLGRIDEVINCGGRKISPVEIEEALAEHPMVAASAAVAAPDPAGVLGQVAQVVVVSRPGSVLSAADVREWLALRLEPYKVPRFVEFADEIPTGMLGKSRRAHLRQTLDKERDAPTS